MNTHGGNTHEEREWQAQERALHDERNGAASGDDPLQVQYRLVARALRLPLPHALPDGFAAQVAARARLQAAHAPDLRIEQRLVRALIAVLALSAAVAVAWYGPQWLHAIAVLLPGAALNWTLALVACIGLSWSFDRLRARHGTQHPTR
ncbi:MAG: hypothetical protein ACMG5Z_02950 [Luteimonas sp.]